MTLQKVLIYNDQVRVGCVHSAVQLEDSSAHAAPTMFPPTPQKALREKAQEEADKRRRNVEYRKVRENAPVPA